jgi:hypothetical protein
MRRIFADIVLFLSIFFVPWWLVVAFAVVGLFTFSSFYEILFLGIVLDSLYNAPIAPFRHFQFVVTLLCVFLFVVIEALKRRLRFS